VNILYCSVPVSAMFLELSCTFTSFWLQQSIGHVHIVFDLIADSAFDWVEVYRGKSSSWLTSCSLVLHHNTAVDSLISIMPTNSLYNHMTRIAESINYGM